MERFTFFWRGPLSQWAKSVFVIDGITYSCAEQWMMASKARLFNDQDTLNLIMQASSPKDQKALGRQVRNFDLDKWNAVARDVVYTGNMTKFSRNPELLSQLLETQGTTLVEASPYDTIWGIGLPEEDQRCKDRSTWLGLNWLGETLTKVRDDLLKQMIMGKIKDLVSCFLFYDRKEDEDLKLGTIEDLLSKNVITVEKMTQTFKNSLLENLS